MLFRRKRNNLHRVHFRRHDDLADRVDRLEREVKRLKKHHHRLPDGTFIDEPWFTDSKEGSK